MNVEKLSQLLMPSFLRKKKHIAWLKCISSPLQRIYSEFLEKQKLDIEKLSYNGQVCYLRGILNNYFDKDKRRIEIVDGNKYKRNYIYTRAEDKPKYLGKMYLRQRSDYADTGVDFIVLIPKEINNENFIYKIKAMVDFYKLASKRYKIVVK